MSIEYQSDMWKSKRDRQFEVLDARLIDIQGRLKSFHSNTVLAAINNLNRKVDNFMATQEERLQAIAVKIDEVLNDLATLKTNNPQIEDEISAIESKLSIAQPTEPPPTEG